MEKTFIKIDNNGKIIAIITTNDDTLVFSKDEIVMDISERTDKDKIIKNIKYFIVKDNKISELTLAEKVTVDKELKIPIPTNNIDNLIKNINDRLDKLEKIVFKDKIA